MKKLLVGMILALSACDPPPSKQGLQCLDDFVVGVCDRAGARIQVCCPHSSAPSGIALCSDFDHMPNVDVLGECLAIENGTCDYVKSVVSGCQ